MATTSTAPPVFLPNGDAVKINDHVYCSPSWSIRDGTPYSIARVMEFLGPQGVPKDEPGRIFLYTRVRLAWYYRPGDVSDRPVADSRLLLAAIYSEVCDINQLRARCYVVHRDKITDFAGWKKRPDCFYFNRLFDPYIKKEFEVIPSTTVTNLPEHIKNTLTSRYEYVVVEKEMLLELTDDVRLCGTCTDWCPSPETVQCDRCKRYFHMGCVQPPLAAKPSRGYGWTCAPCALLHAEQVDSHDVPVSTAKKTNAVPPRGRGRPKKNNSQALKEESSQIKHFRMWPFRYFGQYTVAEDTLDPDDLIFPRTSVRVGPKWQATVPSAPDPTPAPEDSSNRGGEYHVSLESCVDKMTDAQVAEMDERIRSAPGNKELKTSVDWLVEIVRRFSNAARDNIPFANVNMKSMTRTEPWRTTEVLIQDKEWTPDEISAFEDAIAGYGAELRAVRDHVGTRTIYEVVRFYGHWKNGKVGEENNRIREVGKPVVSPGREYKDEKDATIGQRVGLPESESSIIVPAPEKFNGCGACRTGESKTWWKAPRGLATDVLCDNCGMNWRKYADLNVRPLREEAEASAANPKLKLTEKREGTPLNNPVTKRAKTGSSQSTPPPILQLTPSAIIAETNGSSPAVKCHACHRDGPIGKVLKCRKCSWRIHAATVGAVVQPSEIENWTCDICENEETMEGSLNTDCVLCPRPKDKDLATATPSSFLHARKPTEGQGWAHVLCSVLIPGPEFTDHSRLRLVEGISTVLRWRWEAKCSICREIDGAVVRCDECPLVYHVSCAWKAGIKIGFEITPIKNTQRSTAVSTTFKGNTGQMRAVAICNTHPLNRRVIYSQCDTDDSGETALQMYTRLYKQADIGQTYGLLRKARRLDTVFSVRPRPQAADPPPAEEEPVCYRCHTEFSPFFHAMSNFKQFLCHGCYSSDASSTTNATTTNNAIMSNGTTNGNGHLHVANSAIAV